MHSRRCIEETLSEIKVSPRICCCADVNVCPRFPTEPKQIPSCQRSDSPKLQSRRHRPSVLPFLTILELMPLGYEELTRWGDLLKKKKKEVIEEALRNFLHRLMSLSFHQPKIIHHDNFWTRSKTARCVVVLVFFQDTENRKSWGALMKTRMRSHSGFACFSRWLKRKNPFFFSVFRAAETLFQTLPQTK